jgi:hypothetical protein
VAEKDKEAYSEMTVAELKKILKSKKLPISGSKQKLIERLTDKDWAKKHRAEKRRKRQPSEKDKKEGKSLLRESIESILLAQIILFLILRDDFISIAFNDSYFHPVLHYILVNVLLIFFGFVFLYFLTGLENMNGFGTSSNNQSFTLLYLASLLIPVAGIIIGAVYLTNENKQTREAGTQCLIIAILSILAYWFFIFILFS